MYFFVQRETLYVTCLFDSSVPACFDAVCVVCFVFQIPLRDGSVELKLPLMKAEDCGDDEEDDKIVVDTSHEITYGDLGERGSVARVCAGGGNNHQITYAGPYGKGRGPGV